MEGAQRQRDAVTRREQQLHRQIGDPDVVREERSGLEQRITDLQQRFDARRDTLAQQIVERPPAWALAMLGERPAEARVARTGRTRYEPPPSTASSSESPTTSPAWARRHAIKKRGLIGCAPNARSRTHADNSAVMRSAVEPLDREL